MIKKVLLVGFCITMLLLLQFPVSAIQENIPVNDPFEDPDGPLKGGLDDAKDFIHLTYGIFWLKTIGVSIDQTDISDMDGMFHLIFWLISICGVFVFYVLFEFAEAFDILEWEIDGL
ncbi:MAG: hypothetical protein BV456_05860 [Thermoplasmata archaeon M8B2D]|nr:MAG: hypothetical protein BV456_05860 [Thermoplasmata archaeon M8B2D]